LYLQAICGQFSKKLLVANILLPKLKICSDISQSISLQECFVTSYQNAKKSLKKRENFLLIVCTFASPPQTICASKQFGYGSLLNNPIEEEKKDNNRA
jgi:hypothetical protein